jgi:DNA-binding response OmpR family regulator
MKFEPLNDPFGNAVPQSVLIVDDLEANRALLERRLEKFGYRILSADSGIAALRILERETPDIILLDYMMPQMNGLEVLAKLRESRLTREVPVIMVTARAEAEAVVAALDSGADDYVTKPIDFDVLRARMETHIEKRKAASNLARANAVLDQRVTLRSMALADLEGELQGEIRKRQELEAKLAVNPETAPPVSDDAQTICLALETIENGLSELFSANAGGKPINAAKILDLKAQIGKIRAQLATGQTSLQLSDSSN